MNVSGIRLPLGPAFPRVALDDQASAELAFRHFHQRGFRHFGYVGSLRLSYVQHHLEAFRRVLKREGLRCHAYANAARRQKARVGGVAPVEDLAGWLRALPKPVAVMAWGSEIGRSVVDACQDARISVPHDVAVLGSDYDELLSDACRPSLSGIENPSERIGREAAALLDGLMHGTADQSTCTLLPPLRVVERLSSDTLAIKDAQLSRVVRYIREHAVEGITVADVLAAVPMARRSLEQRCMHVLGCTPAEEIRRVKIDNDLCFLKP